jgi:hypothetical protein
VLSGPPAVLSAPHMCCLSRSKPGFAWTRGRRRQWQWGQGNGADCGRRRYRSPEGLPVFECQQAVNLSPIASISRGKAAVTLAFWIELGRRIGQLNCVSSQLSDDLAAPYADHARTGMEPPSSLGTGHAVDIDALQQRSSRIVDQSQYGAGL